MTEKPKPTIDFGYPTSASGDIPSFSSIEEEATFWDTHDTTDLDNDWETVHISVSEHFRETLTLHFSRSERDELVRLANREGVEPTALARKWVLAHLRDGDVKAS